MNVGSIQKPVGSLEILVHLYRNDKATITNLINDARLCQRTTYSALTNLLDQRLISKETTNGFPICKYYKLTQKGHTVAMHLDTIERVLAIEG
ncbi:MAG: helix-turn-helix transcriptional regulator [Thermoplasmata archaeon]|nr:helix-turn-helix transcriptional regulator [Thermoplasmata archaeon]